MLESRDNMNSGIGIPVYHLEDLVSGRVGEESIKECLERVGAFRIINYGIEESVIDKADKAFRDVFGMPMDRKQEYAKSHDNAYISFQPGMPCYETFSVPQNLGISYFSNIMWPEPSNSSPREVLDEYVSKMQELSETILRILLKNYGVEKYYETIFRSCEYKMRINYSHELKTEREEFISLAAHTDIGVVTLVKEDSKIGGLQVLDKETSEWVNVPTMPSSITVFLGDMFRAWSNGRAYNPKHRVMATGPQGARLTVAFFNHFPSDTGIYAPEELIDSAHPRLYKPFYYADFAKAKYGQNLAQLGPVIDTFAAASP